MYRFVNVARALGPCYGQRPWTHTSALCPFGFAWPVCCGERTSLSTSSRPNPIRAAGGIPRGGQARRDRRPIEIARKLHERAKQTIRPQ